jgi:hypothetical protein
MAQENTDPDHDERVDRLFEYTKFHIGIYLSTGGAFLALIGTAEKTDFLRALVGSPQMLLLALFLMIIAGMAGGVVASTTTTINDFEKVWNEPQGPFTFKVFPGRVWAGIEHGAFWLSVLLFSYSILSADAVISWLQPRATEMNTDVHVAIIKLAIAYTLLGAFVFTVVLTCLALIGKFKFPDRRVQRRLIEILVIELAVLGVGTFSDFLRFSPSNLADDVEEHAQTSLPIVEPLATASQPAGERGTQVLSAILPVSLIGVWPRVGAGDTEMDTDSGDKVPVEVRSELKIRDGRYIDIIVFFQCAETRGDKTTFRGEKTITVYTVDPGKRIESIVASGGLNAAFSSVTRGEAHRFYPLDVKGTYWRRLSFRVDGRGSNDNERVGIAGDLSIEIKLVDASQ